MNDIEVLPEDVVITRRILLDRTRQWEDFLKIDEWKPGELHQCNYQTLVKDFGLRLDRTKPESFLRTLRSNAHYLYEYEDYPRILVSQAQIKDGKWVVFISKAPDKEEPFAGTCPKVKITEIPTADISIELRLVHRTSNGRIEEIHTDKDWLKETDVSKTRWIDLLDTVLKDYKIPAIAAQYSFIDPDGKKHPRNEITDPVYVAWINKVGKDLGLDEGAWIDFSVTKTHQKLTGARVQEFEEIVRTFESAAPGTISGTVKDINNTAIPRATVEADGVSATTDANGAYSIDIAPGTHILKVSATGFATRTVDIYITPGRSITYEWVLKTPAPTATPATGAGATTVTPGASTPTTGTIIGIVTNDAGNPIPDATVAANGESVTTDANGAYRINIAPGSRNVTASATGFEPITAVVNVASGRTFRHNFTMQATPTQTPT